MKKVVLFLFLSFSLLAVDYPTFYKELGNGYKGSSVYIDGEFTNYRCYKESGSRASLNGYCKVFLDVYHDNNFLRSVAVFVGTTWESDLKSSKKGDTFSFSCTYKNSLSIFKDCN